MQFFDLLTQVIVILRRERRVTYWALKQTFHFDDAFLDGLRRELIFKKMAIDENGIGLVWIGDAEPMTAPGNAAAMPEMPENQADMPAATSAELPPMVTELDPPPFVQPEQPGHGEFAGSPDVISATVPVNGAATPLPEVAETEEPAPETPTRTSPDAERRQLTVMFCDLVGSTRLSGQLDPEDLREVVRTYQDTAAEVIERYDGHIARYMGDGILVYFGYPRAHEDDAQRAVQTALSFLETVPEMNRKLEARLPVIECAPVEVRIGIHTGPVVIETIGTGLSREYQALGETPNIAARLEGLAESGSVVVSPVTARLVERIFILEKLGDFELKGVAEPMTVSRVVELRTERPDTESMAAGRRLMLLGREEEQRLLLRRWEQSKEGIGQVVLVSGEAGIGKSCLTDFMRRQVRAEELTRVVFSCSPYHEQSALYPFVVYTQRMIGWEANDPIETRLKKIEEVLRRFNQPVAESTPLIAGLLSLPLPEGRYPDLGLTPQQWRHQTQDLIIALLLEASERQPVLVIWEDLHWADPSTLELLGVIIAQVPTVPMLHILTYRPEFEPPWPMRSHMTPIVLNRLERPQVEAFIAQLAGGKKLPDEVVQHVVTKTDGVPLYVEELTKMLLGSELLREEFDHYELTGPMLTVAIPDTLQASLMARLDQLQAAKEIAQLGAVFGREFTFEMLRALASVEVNALQQALDQLVETELIYQRGRPPRATYIFKHALIQDTAYDSLLRSTRQDYHRQIAEMLESRFPETIEMEPELLAQHFTEGNQIERAVAYWRRAGRHAIAASAHAEAVSHLTKGLAILHTLVETPERDKQELALQTTLGATLIASKGYAAPEVEHTYMRARALCEQTGETSRLLQVLFGLQALYLVRGAMYQARDMGEECLALAQANENPPRVPHAHFALGSTLFFLGEFALARDHLEQGIAIYDREKHAARGLNDPGVSCLIFASWTLWQLGFPDQALSRIREAIALSEEMRSPFSLAFALACGATVYHFRREVETVYETAEAARLLSKEKDFPHWLALATPVLGWAAFLQGDREQGLEWLHQGMRDWRSMGAEQLVPYQLGLLTEVYRLGGLTEEGMAVVDEALTISQKNGQQCHKSELYRLKGELLLELPENCEDGAEACFQQALDVAWEQQAKSWELRAAMSMSRLWQRQGKEDEARELLATVYRKFTEGFETADLREARSLLEALGMWI